MNEDEELQFKGEENLIERITDRIERLEKKNKQLLKELYGKKKD